MYLHPLCNYTYLNYAYGWRHELTQYRTSSSIQRWKSKWPRALTGYLSPQIIHFRLKKIYIIIHFHILHSRLKAKKRIPLHITNPIIHEIMVSN